ncbi:MAG: hypothetical protein ACT6S0_21885 [Roseateles sp.]|uniref:hypothetical protein n=1 Tax=Roseateles sp. TaxID=1971397 RepID=UPI004036DACE
MRGAPALNVGATALRWLRPGRTRFELLDKPIVYLPGPELQLRAGAAWTPVYAGMALDGWTAGAATPACLGPRRSRWWQVRQAALM